MHTRAKLALSLTAVSTVLGLMIGVQYRQTSATAALGLGYLRGTVDTHTLTELKNLKASNQAAEQELTQLNDELNQFERVSSGSDKAMTAFQQRLTDERILAGITAVEGPGISVTLSDGASNGSDVEQILTHDWNVRSVINELFTAGAEAVSINGYRVVATSGVFCSGPVVRVNNHRLGAPFTIEAIGDPETLKSALDIQGGILDVLRMQGLNVTVPQIKQKIVMSAYTGSLPGSPTYSLNEAIPSLSNNGT
ncbi:DUF881 domain-containing protein [Alicyclobacillus tolerans]|uniref:Uncharacterized protein YlxW (UPF0749 family) n=2 Tax=Alicyclobacillus tolerans TaxID=90970 RepID=A0ABT9LVV8_9BACL|nr:MULTISPECIES: DUF881 domain-containing protein [Alicyclobacillus]MDP9728395.1 uncharacterized protein YlxW (UPF0749 family) [Alicyclobacillus tengchongensis]QRF23811.1 DUF881 domain-containing protein [Alicyclobacillus sp. TC]SHK14986.1 Uncharacterized conserved protein YlxW, UPF0749 family [Alicyclobacillus montanus]